ncbi:MAG TPA: trifunctional transcriptional activator/DNA repair protein Ada/methylated-DNA--[protein]-cysteine S-methyltransferase [Thermoanaerobaculia bacterium]|nr:trifunctional transcriptional activator/DNA repair protein Ada/methylated-DNA--[protein]-cysteine S-methyltransferase [Thermoanaerobaculia bacterium]
MTPNLLPERVMMKALLERDASFDGLFVAAVTTTGIFCKPSCPARKPLERNVRFFPSPAQASFAGYRPCKRCRPLSVAAAPEWVERLFREIEAREDKRIRDSELRRMGIDPARARRFFQKHYGLTFQAYVRARRLGSALARIRSGEPLEEVVFASGYESHSGFRDAFSRTFGKPPGRSRSTDCVVTSLLDTPLGPMLAGATTAGVCLLEFSDRRMLEFQLRTIRRLCLCAIVPGSNRWIEQMNRELGEYFAGMRRRFDVALVTPGTSFQQRVWTAVRAVPFGETRTYEDIAQEIGEPSAVRAAGHANGLNRIAILIPCHRLVRKDGTLGGYGGGLWRKRRLLDLEEGAVGALSVGASKLRTAHQ